MLFVQQTGKHKLLWPQLGTSPPPCLGEGELGTTEDTAVPGLSVREGNSDLISFGDRISA